MRSKQHDTLRPVSSPEGVINPHRAQLPTHMHLDRAPISENTKRSYACDLDHFLKSGGSLPPTPESLQAYLTAYVQKVKGVKTNSLYRRLTAIRHYCKSVGIADVTHAPSILQLMKRIKEVHSVSVKRAQPLVIEELHRVDDVLWASLTTSVANPALRADAMRLARDRALLLVGFWCGLHTSELLQLTIRDLQVSHTGQCKEMHVELPCSRNHPYGRHQALTAQSKHCPVEAVETWKSLARFIDPNDSAPLFRAVNMFGDISDGPLKAGSVAKLFRRRLRQAGLDYERYSLNSLRSGFAVSAGELGIDTIHTQNWVGWKSSAAVNRYVWPTRTAAAQLLERAERGYTEPLTLSAEQWRQLRQLGNGDVGEGIRYLLRCWSQDGLPTPLSAKASQRRR